VQSVIDDTALTRVITVPSQPEWQVPPAAPAEVAGTIGEAARAGVGLGEWLSGYPDLADRYTAARWPTRALVDLVVDWDTSGIGVPLPSGVAYSLWEDYAATRLPRDELRRFMRLTDHEIHHEWTEAQAFAEREVTLGAALITVGTEGLMASEFSRVYSARTAVSARIWDHLLHTYPATPEQRLNLGLRALEFGTPQRALRAFESILFYRDEDAAAGRSLLVEITARRGVALYHACLGHDEQAVVAYTDLIDTFGGHDDAEVAEQVAHALLGLGITFGRMGSHGQAASAFGELIGRYGDGKLVGMRVQVAQGLIGQAVTFGQLGRRSDEISAYTEVLDRYERDDSSALAAMCDVARAALDRLHGGRG
jgi:tetratricopeptide (TPR) repeat protein